MKISYRKQLVFRMPDFSYLDRVERGDCKFEIAKNMSLLTWPNGRLCFEATAHLQMMIVESHVATLIRGGTLRTKAFHLSHLIRSCFEEKIDFIDLTNEQISLFLQSLVARSKDQDGDSENQRRNGTTLHSIGCDWLDFLEFVGMLHGDQNFVGANGKIRAKRVQAERGGYGGLPRRMVSIWEHSALPTRDEYRTRSAISLDVLKKLTAAVPKCVKSKKFSLFRKRQLHLILRVLRTTGLRRAELCRLKIADIRAAMKKKVAVLRVVSVKKKKHTTRDIEINHAELNEILQFTKLFRASVVREHLGEGNDHDYLFISATTGKQLSDNTITQWIRELRLAAGVEQQACAHMFRHLFAVEKLCRLMEKHQKMSRTSFKEAMLEGRALKLEVMRELGHVNEATLDIYLQDAEAMLVGLQKIKKSVRADLLDDSLKTCEQQHQMRLADGVPLVVSLGIFHESAMCIQRDAEYLRSHPSD